MARAPEAFNSLARGLRILYIPAASETMNVHAQALTGREDHMVCHCASAVRGVWAETAWADCAEASLTYVSSHRHATRLRAALRAVQPIEANRPRLQV